MSAPVLEALLAPAAQHDERCLAFPLHQQCDICAGKKRHLGATHADLLVLKRGMPRGQKVLSPTESPHVTWRGWIYSRRELSKNLIFLSLCKRFEDGQIAGPAGGRPGGDDAEPRVLEPVGVMVEKTKMVHERGAMRAVRHYFCVGDEVEVHGWLQNCEASELGPGGTQTVFILASWMRKLGNMETADRLGAPRSSGGYSVEKAGFGKEASAAVSAAAAGAYSASQVAASATAAAEAALALPSTAAAQQVCVMSEEEQVRLLDWRYSTLAAAALNVAPAPAPSPAPGRGKKQQQQQQLRCKSSAGCAAAGAACGGGLVSEAGGAVGVSGDRAAAADSAAGADVHAAAAVLASREEEDEEDTVGNAGGPLLESFFHGIPLHLLCGLYIQKGHCKRLRCSAVHDYAPFFKPDAPVGEASCSGSAASSASTASPGNATAPAPTAGAGGAGGAGGKRRHPKLCTSLPDRQTVTTAWMQWRRQQRAYAAFRLQGDTLALEERKAHGGRAEAFVDWLLATCPREVLEKGVLDVAGGKGEVSNLLALQHGIPCTIVDCRPPFRDKKVEKLLQKEPDKKGLRPRYLQQWFGQDFFSKPENAELFLQQAEGRAETDAVGGGGGGGERGAGVPAAGAAGGSVSSSSPLLKLGIVIGYHPDQATEPIVDFALQHGLPFAIVPCCVFNKDFPHRRLRSGGEVCSYTDFLRYLREKVVVKDSVAEEGQDSASSVGGCSLGGASERESAAAATATAATAAIAASPADTHGESASSSSLASPATGLQSPSTGTSESAEIAVPGSAVSAAFLPYVGANVVLYKF